MADDNNNIQQYPYMFDPSQFSNKYSPTTFQGQIPWPAVYDTGNESAPTDAMGRPIQAYIDKTQAANAQYQQQLAAYNAQQAQGTTLNSTSQAGQYPQGIYTPGAAQKLMGGMQQGGSIPLSQLAGGAGPQPTEGKGGWMQGTQANQGSLDASGLMMLLGMDPSFGMPQQAAPQQAASAAPTPPNSWNAAIAALSNPGHVNTPGATLPAPPNAHPNMLNAFLANWKPSAPGAGGYNTNGFAQAMQGGFG